MPQATRFLVELPEWATKELAAVPDVILTVHQRMALVNKFARLNVEHNTGGPFAAAVFERASGKLVAMGVNRVERSGCSSAHAEVVALSLAQQTLGSFDLGAPNTPEHELVVNWRPCAMCYGAVLWSGVQSLVIAGNGPELEDITGFDEGPLLSEWKEELERRGIAVIMDVGREDALEVFKTFRSSGNKVYNGRGGVPVK